MKYDSYYYKNEIKEKLKAITYEIDGMYNTLEDKLRNEIVQKQEEKQALHKEADEMFERLNYTICDKILKKKLPLRVRLFNNIKCMGFAVTPRNQIELEFTFNDRFGTRFRIELGLEEIHEYIR
jgi:hypothetical protein